MRAWIIAITTLCIFVGDAAHAQPDEQRETATFEKFKAGLREFNNCAVNQAKNLAINSIDSTDSPNAVAHAAAAVCDKQFQEWRTVLQDIKQVYGESVDEFAKIIDDHKTNFIDSILTPLISIEQQKLRVEQQKPL